MECTTAAMGSKCKYSYIEEHLDKITINASPDNMALPLKLIGQLTSIQIRPLPERPPVQGSVL